MGKRKKERKKEKNDTNLLNGKCEIVEKWGQLVVVIKRL